MFSLSEVLDQPTAPVRIVDIGAMLIEGQPEVYSPLVRRGLARVCGFEPVGEECERMNRLHAPTHRFLPYCIADGSVRPFYINSAAMTSSLFRPNTDFLAQFENLENLTRVVQVEEVSTRRLDDVEELRDGVDYLKLDVQGAELEVLQHAERILGEAVAIHTEVEFVPLYQEQPLFADVDAHLRSRGFMLHRIYSVAGRPYSPLVANGDPNAFISQHLWGDVIYVRDVMKLHLLPPEKLLALALVLHEVYRSVDLCYQVLKAYDDSVAARYLQRVVCG